MNEPLVEVLTFAGCPHAGPALALAKRIVAESGRRAKVHCVDIPNADAAAAHRFLGSPTIRVNGRDIEPGVQERTEYVLACRTYRTDAGLTGEPDAGWLREALNASR